MTKATKEPTKNLATKLAEVTQQVAYVQKDQTNEFHKYRYASAEAVLKKVNEALSSRNISIASGAELLSYEQNNAIVRLTLKFVDGDSNEIQAVQGIGQGADKGDKAVMKANTAALKYTLSNAFLISWGDDPEADVSTDKEANKKPRQTKSKKETFKTVFSRKELDDALVEATTLDAVKQLKGKIVTMRGTDHYEPLVSAYKKKVKELNV